MKIRTYLILSFLVLLVVVALGLSTVGELAVEKVAQNDLQSAEGAVNNIVQTNYRLSKRVLSYYGEKLVEIKAEKVAKEISYILRNRDSYDYEKLRQDKNLREIATQDIFASAIVAGYSALLDRSGNAVLHPNEGVEGKNLSEWKSQFPDMWDLVERSSSEKKVKGFYSFLDREGMKRKKYMVIAQVSGTPLTVAAVLNADRIQGDDDKNLVEIKAEKLAEKISYILRDKNAYDYEKLRQDHNLREIAVQDIFASGIKSGYCALLDKKGNAVLHPNKSVERRGLSEWKTRFPDMWKLIEQSFSERKVKGYYRFVDRENRESNKFMVVIRVPGTQLSVAAVVNIDQYFKPLHKQIEKAGNKEKIRAESAIRVSSAVMIKKQRYNSAAAALAILAVAALFGLWLARFISGPITRLRDAVTRVGEGDFKVEVPEAGAREVKYLARSFNHLGNQLAEYIDKRDFIRDTFGRYLTQEVVNRLLESQDGLELGGESREISLMMSDLRGFTALSSGRPPEEVITILNRYLGKMVEILMDHRGIIDEIIGDGILAFFGAPEPVADHAAQAVVSALLMQLAMEEVNIANEAEGLPWLEMGVAVNTGEVVVGNIGSEKRTKYGAVGSQVNLTGRVESFTVGGQVLITRTTYEKLSDILRVRKIITVEMKGMTDKVDLYDITGIGSPYNVYLTEKDETLVPIHDKINALVFRLDEKIVTDRGIPAQITHISDSKAKIILPEKLLQWENVRMQLLSEQLDIEPGEVYAKIVSVAKVDQKYAAEIHFTSVSPEANQIFRTRGKI